MPAVLTVIIVVALAALVVVVAVLWRLRRLNHRVGSFECALYEGKHWNAGIATYTRDHLEFYGVVSLSLRPARSWSRRGLDIRKRLPPAEPGALSEVACQIDSCQFRLAAGDGALDGLRSWLEAAPPDASTSRIV